MHQRPNDLRVGVAAPNANEVAAAEKNCAMLDTRVNALHLSSIIFGAVSGGATAGSGIAQIYGDTTVRYALVGSAVVLTVLGTTLGGLATFEASVFAHENCK